MSALIKQHTLLTRHLLALYQGDLTDERVDAIVNAANEHLWHGGGLAGAIVRKGGNEIQRESQAWIQQHGKASHAQPALTGPGKLPCKAIIHAVGPMWRGGKHNEVDALQAAYNSALLLAESEKFSSLAFPSISTGIFGFPVDRAAQIAIHTVCAFCETHPNSVLREIRFTIIDAPTVTIFHDYFNRQFQS